MSRPSPRLATYLTATAVLLLGATALGRPALAAAAAPFALFLLVGGLTAPAADAVTVDLSTTPERLLEGDEFVLSIDLYAAATVPDLRLALALPEGIEPRIIERTLALNAGEDKRLDITLRARRWGGFAVGPAHVRIAGDLSLRTRDETLGTPRAVRVFPRPEQLRGSLIPRHTRPQPGTLPSRDRGDGLELADLRPFAPGDRARRVNWRATARHGQPYVTDRRLERGTDVVLFLDTFAGLGTARGGTLERTIHAADALATRHLARGDRVAIVGFGGTLDWLTPGGGTRQRYRIAEQLIDSEIVFTYTTRDTRVLPQRLLPSHALVVALTPLLDERGFNAILDLRGRGFDIVVIVISPFHSTRLADPLADRLWHLDHDAHRLRLQHAGIAVAEWTPPRPLDVSIQEVNRSRRFAAA